MAEIVRMPKLSDTMTDGVIAKWHKKVGDKVKSGELLADIETDKATMEFESFQDGVLLHIGIPEKQAVPVDSIIAILGTQGEDISAILNDAGNKTQEVTKQDTKVESSNQTTNNPTTNTSSPTTIPEGVEVVRMPKLSDTMTEGVIEKWHKKVGDKVKSGELLADIATDKATMEFESFQDGVLIHIGIEEGKSIPVDSIIAILGKGGEDIKAILAAVNQNSNQKLALSKVEGTEVKTEKVESGKVETVSNKNVNVASVSKNSDSRIKASPLAKALAKEKGIDIAQVNGSGDNGRITKKDIETFTPGSKKQGVFTGGKESYTDEPASLMRKTIARRLLESKNGAPHFYLTIECDMDNAIASRTALNNFGDVKKDTIQSDMLPSLATRVKQKLRIKNPKCVGYDILFGCPGWIEGVIQAKAFIKSGMAKKCLVIGAETLSRVVDVHDRDSMIYSDGAGATIIEATEDEGGILTHATATFSFDEGYFLFYGKSFNQNHDPEVRYIKMHGRKIYEFALNQVPKAMKECLRRASGAFLG